MYRSAAVLSFCAGIAASAVSCSAGNDDQSTNGSAAGGASGSTTQDASSSDGTGGGFMGSSVSTVGVGGGCAGDSFKAEPVPLDIFIMLDQSGSMDDPAGAGQTRWEAVTAAITEFVQQPDADGLGVGLQYFGQPEFIDSTCMQNPCVTDTDCTGSCTLCHPTAFVCLSPWNSDNDSCVSLDYAWAEVPIATLPGVAQTIVSSMLMHWPGTNTPTYPALEGAIDYASGWAAAHPDHITVVAFATDGGPAVCNTDLDDINAVAAAGYAATPSIRTFVIGVGPLVAALDGIAAAGGTGSAYHVGSDMDATENFVAALNDIRGAAIGCTYQLPEPPPGETLDFGLVNVTYTPGGMGAPETLPHVDDEASCPADGMAWYYDDPAAPTQIILCEGACDVVEADIMAQVDVVLGCQTLVP